MDRQARRERRDEDRRAPREAGVFRVRNGVTGRALIGATPDVRAMANRFAFARSTGSAGALDLRLRDEIRAHGIAAFEFEILESFVPADDQGPEQVRADLDVMAALWRERSDAEPLP